MGYILTFDLMLVMNFKAGRCSCVLKETRAAEMNHVSRKDKCVGVRKLYNDEVFDFRISQRSQPDGS